MRTLALTFVLALSTACFAQDSYKQTVWHPKEGQESVWGIELKFQVSGMDAVFSGNLHRKTLKVNPDLTSEVESWNADAKVVVGSTTMDQPGTKQTTKLDADGKPLEKQDFHSSADETISAYVSVRLPADGAKVGDKWNLTDKFDRFGKGQAEFIGTAEFCGRKCLESKVTYTPLAGGSSEGKVYVDAETGLLVGFEMAFKGLTVGPGIESDGTATMKLVTP